MQETLALLRSWFDAPGGQALAFVLGSLLAAWVVDLAVTRVLRRLTQRTRSTADDRIVAALHRPVFTSVVLVGLYLAINRLSAPDPPLLVEPFPFILIASIKTLAVVLWGVAAFRLSRIVLEGLSGMADRVRWLDARTLPLFDNVAKIAIFGLGIYFFMLSWQIDLTAWLASAGVIGIVLGLAAKDTVANLFGGMFILADAPYKVGDFIILETGERGRVTQIGLRSTRVLTRDDVEITIPNAQIASVKITNESGGPWEKERVRATVGVAYGSDIEDVRRALVGATERAEHIAREPAPRVRFREFGDSALIFQVLCWVDEPVVRGRALDALNTAIYNALNDAGIQIPFPQRDVHIKQAPEAGENQT